MTAEARAAADAEPYDSPAFDDPRLSAAVDEYLRALERGEQPRRADFLAKHPDIAGALAECLDGLELVQSAAPKPKIAPDPLGQPIGDFKLVSEIGRGGMGIVYEAEQLSLGRRVALKVLPFAAALDPKHLQRFKNEAQAAACLHHTNIVPVYAVGCERGVHFYAMQLIEGRTLASVIRELRHLANADDPSKSWPSDIQPAPASHEKSSSLFAESTGGKNAGKLQRSREFYRTAAKLGVQAAEALEYAHQMGIVHRDVKPANLIVDHRGNLWVTDFGLAQLPMDASLTMTGDVLGTLRYMSPEQALGKGAVLDHRTDVYSLGATLYELLTLEPAVPGSDRAELLSVLKDDDPKPPRDIDRHIPLELETVVLKSISKTPQERYGSAQEFADDLNRFLGDLPIRARRPSLFDRMQKWARRHRAWVTAAAVLFVLGSLALGVTAAVTAQAHARTTNALASERKALENERALAQELRQQRESAEERFKQARDAVDLLTRLGAEEIGDSPELLDIRRQLLETALAYYQDFIGEQANNPTLQAELSAARERLVVVLGELAHLKENDQTLFFLHLLGGEDVRRDLKLDEGQIGRVEDLVGQVARPSALPMREFLKLPASERSRQHDVHARELRRRLEAALTPMQMSRLLQLSYAARGARVFAETDVARTLELDKPQRDRIQTILDEEKRVRIELMRPGLSLEDRIAAFDFLNATSSRIVAELRPAQHHKWEQLTGPKFEGRFPRFGFVPRSGGKGGRDRPPPP